MQIATSSDMQIQRTYPNSDARTDDRWIIDLVLVLVLVGVLVLSRCSLGVCSPPPSVSK
jgi:hypothetical protein